MEHGLPKNTPFLMSYSNIIVSDLNLPLNFLADMLTSYNDQTEYNLILAWHPFMIWPTSNTWNRLRDAIQRHRNWGCQLIVNINIVVWWQFSSRRRLQALEIKDPRVFGRPIAAPDIKPIWPRYLSFNSNATQQGLAQ